MAVEDTPPPHPSPSHTYKIIPFSIPNKVPIQLDLKKHYYNSWSSFSLSHLGSLGLKSHVEEDTASTNPDWCQLDDLIKMWILRSLCDSLQEQVVTTSGATTTFESSSSSPTVLMTSTSSSTKVTKSSTLLAAFVFTSSTTWHQRLGHPVDEVLRSLSSRQFISCNKAKSTHVFHACQLGLFLSQKKYALQLPERADMANYNPSHTPVDTDSKLDLSYAVQQVCFYMHDPREPHFASLKRILRYLQGTLELGLHLYVFDIRSLVGYTDADWVGCPSTRRFTFGYCVFLGDNLLSWYAKQQHTISRSSAEAEYQGVANVVAETAWIRNLLRKLHSPLLTATLVYCDNPKLHLLSTLCKPTTVPNKPISTYYLCTSPSSGPILPTSPSCPAPVLYTTAQSEQQASWTRTETRHILLRCDSSGDLYPVTKPSTIPTALLSTSSSTWHQCLGHPGDEVLRQQLSIDCDETFSPVVKPATIRTVFSIAVSRKLCGPRYPHHVCFLQKCLYGLKQAPRAWFQRFAGYATRVGFYHNRCDSSLFILRQGSQVAYLLIYVDEFILTASSTYLLQQVITSLYNEFDMTDLEALNYFLGISATRHSTGLFLSQKQYAIELLARAHMTNCNPSRTLVDTNFKLGPEGVPVQDPTLYPSLAGGLQYLTFTRPDICYAIQQICLYMHDPREPHLAALKRILRYIRGTLDFGFHLYSSTTISLVGYTDVDWAGCPSTRRSTSAETAWLRNLLRELHSLLSAATLVYCDNVSTTYLSANPVQHQRTKHIEIDINFVRDLVTAGQVRVLHVPSRYQYADIFTKGLPSALFEDFRSSLSVRLLPARTARAY
nr:ribonuclease H-like domain-containing protein [Tanacetum cinerariifolium]